MKTLVYPRLLLSLILLFWMANAGATITLVGTSGDSTGNPGTGFTLSRPGGTASGDVLLAQLTTRRMNNVSTASGWTLLQHNISGELEMRTFLRVAQESEPTQYTWGLTPDPGAPGLVRIAGAIASYRGVDPLSPIGGQGHQSGSGNTVTAPSLTVGPAGGQLVTLFANANGGATLTTPGGMTSVSFQQIGAGPNGATIRVTHEPRESGPTGSRVSTSGTSTNWVAQSFVLNSGAAMGPHHIRLLHSGQGLTCTSVPVTVQACADADCSALFTDPVDVSLATSLSGGTWSQNPVPVTGETTVHLRYLAGGAITLLASAPAATNETQCVNTSGGPPCQITFADVGVLLDGDGDDGITKSDVPEQIAGKPSNTGYNAAVQRVRVVRTDDETGACVAGLQNAELTAQFSYLVPVATDGLADNTLIIQAATTATLTSSGAPESVNLMFGSDGSAPFSFQSMDAGRYALRVDLDIPVFDESNNPTGDVIPSYDTSNMFVVRPLAVYVGAVDNPAAADHEGDPFKKAGEVFDLTFKSLRWQPGLDGNGDGRWDGCGSVMLSDPGVYAWVPAWNIGQPAVDLTLPTGGINPGLTYSSGDAVFAQGTSETAAEVSFGEVGIIRFETSVAFQGVGVDVCSSNIGRFTPDHFHVALVNQPSFQPACGTFTYLSQPFTYATAPQVRITARNRDGAITQNYDGPWWRLSHISPDYSHGGPDSLPDGVVFVEMATHDDPIQCNGCQGEVTVGFGGEFTYDRNGDPVDPINGAVRVEFEVVDADGVAFPGNPFVFTIGFEGGNDEQRWGRLEMQNAHGPELLPLTVPMYTTYFRDGAFRLNTEDNCTAIDASDIALDIQLSGGTTSASVVNTPASGGRLDVRLNAPGAGNTGYVDVTPDISVSNGADLPWLTFDWDGDGTLRGPEARATFGVYGGNERHIYIRELP
ncbi:DUF6701 domain-containing protein [Thioalkalivibrio sulfidiphilus]|uniref:DUF6701 domain-containing protein n=1 Tax=Thioalkalivibrio sulfidiphilus TaxID=1033854 RepID=UPI00037A639A|nr:DUF6701 domain-containing protein [Thioalkalivibrio sulfidiphilus]